MQKSILAGVVYFGCVFAAGFALGVLRTVLVVAVVGETVAVALELPITSLRFPGSPVAGSSNDLRCLPGSCHAS